MTKNALATSGALAAVTLILAGCMGDRAPSGGGPVVRAPSNAVEGSWIDAQGTGLSTFSSGVFTTVATDTGQKLAEGSYALNGATNVRINGTSLIRQQPISFNCLLVSTTQLNCTSSANQQFVLSRRA